MKMIEKEKKVDKQTWYSKGCDLLLKKRFEEAIECFDKVLELDPVDIMTWNYKGVASYTLGRFEDALWSFEKVLELSPGYPVPWNWRGLVLCELGRFEDALGSVEKAIKINPKFGLAHYSKARIESLRKNTNKSIKSLKIAIKLDSEYRNLAKQNPNFDNIRQTKKFKDLVKD